MYVSVFEYSTKELIIWIEIFYFQIHKCWLIENAFTKLANFAKLDHNVFYFYLFVSATALTFELSAPFNGKDFRLSISRIVSVCCLLCFSSA